MPIRSLATARRLSATDAAAARERLRALSAPRPVEDVSGGPPIGPAEPAEAAGLVAAEPTTRRPVWAGLEIGRSAALGLVVLGAAVVAVTALVLLHRRPVPVQAPRVSTSRPAVSGSAPSGRPAVTVDVAGKVRRPGVVNLPAGSRVVDALRAAGGPRRDADVGLLNLAAPLVDGEQIVVGVPAAGTGTATGGASGDPSGLVDLNTATESDLDNLPGIGPVLAQNILDFRASHNGFTSVDELQQVDGIGPAKFGQIKGRVRV